jgi:hypothetical protein
MIEEGMMQEGGRIDTTVNIASSEERGEEAEKGIGRR